MKQKEELGKVLDVAAIVAKRYCRRYRVFPGQWEEIKQTAGVIALESLEGIPPPIESRLNWLARKIWLRLIDEYRREKRRRGKEIVEAEILNDDDAESLDIWEPTTADPAMIIEDAEKRAKIWEAYDAALATFDATDREIVKRRVLMNENFSVITKALGARRKKIKEVVAEFTARFKSVWQGDE